MMDKKTGKKSFKGAMRIGMVMLAVVGTSAVWGQSRVIRKEVPIKSGNKATDAAPVGKPTQQATPKPACPAAIYQKACDSYLELLNAKDADVTLKESASRRRAQGDVVLVCFQRYVDSFFVLSLGGPRDSLGQWPWHFDADKKSDIDNDAVLEFGHVTEFIAGIKSYTTPIGGMVFRGLWRGPSDPVVFRADEINRTAVDDNLSGLLVDPAQVSAALRYTNTLNKKVDYALKIQRSTGRFTERYIQEGEQVPFIERQGRCITPSQQ